MLNEIHAYDKENNFIYIDRDFTSRYNIGWRDNIFFKTDPDKTSAVRGEYFTTDNMIVHYKQEKDFIMIYRTT
jgi:hypothetical protein